MRRFWGAALGLGVGTLGGVWGAVFGVFMGALCDLVLVELRVSRAAQRFLRSGTAPAWLPRTVVLLGALYGHLRPPGSPVDPDALELMASRTSPCFPDRYSRRPVERMILTAAAHDWVGAGRFAALLREQPPESRELLFSTVWEALRVWGLTSGARDEVRDLARQAGIDEGFILRELVVQELLDPHACAVLGIPRDADPDEARTAYRRLASQFHPDTAASLSDQQRRATEEAFKQVQAAYEKVRATPDRQ
jgi:hypothetical protein